MNEMLSLKLTEALTSPIPAFTAREVRLPGVEGKAFSVIGIRRSGKTTFLRQIMKERMERGEPRHSQILLELEDERLVGLQAADLGWLVEEYFRRYPALRGDSSVTLYLDEIQVVPGWETFVRRMIDTEKMQIFLSGSSSRMLSREIASSMRGRALDVVIRPFSFREALRFVGVEPSEEWKKLSPPARSDLDHRLRKYLVEGGFPEAQGLSDGDRFSLLRSYVDVVVLRDVIERYEVSNPTALRWMQRQLLSNPAGLFSVQKYHGLLKSQGIPVSKDTLHAYLSFLQDAFLVDTVTLHTASERRRMVNPRKVYPADQGLIPIYERTGRPNLGHAFEVVVYNELKRRGYEVDYVLTPEGFVVDFIAFVPGQSDLLIQVSLDVSDTQTSNRELRALTAARDLFPNAVSILITLDPTPPGSLPEGVEWRCAADWLLDW
jgi:predicted AAA+ superfamily ATPase